MKLQLIGINHKTAPVEVRERLAIPESRLAEACKKLAEHPAVAEGMIVSTCNRVELVAAVEGADAVYTDVCVSMGFEHESTKREPIFRPYQVNEALMAKASPRAVFMHCLPARRNAEVTDAVLDGPQSIAFDQAENRLHVQKALLLLLLDGLKNVGRFSSASSSSACAPGCFQTQVS